MIGAIQTHGELLHWHPHIHVLITCGAFTPEGEFLELPEFDRERLLDAWHSRSLRAVLGRGEDRTGSRREHAELGTQRLPCRPVGPFASGRSSWYRAARAVHDLLSFQPLSVGEGERHRADRLPSREAGLPGLSRPEGRWDASGSAAARAAGVRPCVRCSSQGQFRSSLPPVTRWLVLLIASGHGQRDSSRCQSRRVRKQGRVPRAWPPPATASLCGHVTFSR